MSEQASSSQAKPPISDRIAGLRSRIQGLKAKQSTSGSFDAGSVDPSLSASTDFTSAEERKKLLARMRAVRSSANFKPVEEDNDAELLSEDGQPSISTTAEEAQPFLDATEAYYELTGIERPTVAVGDTSGYGAKLDDKRKRDEACPPLPILVVPAAKLFAQPSSIEKGCYASLVCCQTCFSCQGGASPLSDYTLRDERDIAAEEWVFHRPDNVDPENAPLLALERDSSHFEGLDYIADDQAGLYRGGLPTLAPVLLRGERVLPAVASLTMPYTLLSRATQRILRDIASARRRRDGRSESEQQALLKFLAQMSVFRSCNDPIDYSYSQLVLPPVSKAFGGQLGQWGAHATALQRLGPIPGSLTRLAGDGALLKLYLFQIVLTDHPLMNGEERCVAELREMFTQYSGLFELKTVEYLVYRIYVLSSELRTLLATPVSAEGQGDGVEDEHVNHLLNCYNELLELIPALHECSRQAHSSTESVYNKWRDLCEQRRRQGFVGSPVVVRVRRLQSNLSPSDGSAGDAQMAAEATGQSVVPVSEHNVDWPALRSALARCAEDLPTAQQRLFPAPPAPTTAPQDSEVAAPASPTAEQDPTASKRRREMLLVTSAANELIRNNQLVPRYVMQLSESLSTTAYTLLPEAELRRRKDIQSCVYKCVVKVNNNVVTTIKFNKDLLGFSSGDNIPSNAVGAIKHPQFLINFKKYLEIKLLHLPNEVSVDIMVKIRHHVFSRYELVATVLLPLPQKRPRGQVFASALTHLRGGYGQDRHNYTHNLVAKYGGFAFTSGMDRVAKYHSQSHAQRLASAWLGEDDRDFRRTAGILYCAIDFDPLLPDYTSNHASRAFDGHDGETLALIPAPYRADEHRVLKHKSSRPALNLGDLFVDHRRSGRARGAHGDESHANAGAGYHLIYDISRENDFQVLLPNYHQLDVNNPYNDYLVYLKSKKLFNNENNVFRLQGLDHADYFLHPSADGEDMLFTVNYMKVKSSLRMKLLRLRNRKPYLFTVPIPLFDKAIAANAAWMSLLSREYPTDDILSYQLRASTGGATGAVMASTAPAGRHPPGGTGLASIVEDVDEHLVDDVHRKKYRITSFLQRVRNSYVILNRSITKKHFQTANIVMEIDYTPQFVDIREQLMFRRRALKPKVVAIEEKGVHIQHCEVLVQVVGAKNVPVRSRKIANATPSSATSGPSAGPMSPGGKGGPADTAARPQPTQAALQAVLRPKQFVRSFVEVKFQDHILQTITLDGSHPYYKHSLSLPFMPPHNDFSPMYLEQVRDVVYFTLFDEVFEDDAGRGGFMEGEVTTRREKRYLGSFSIPFATLYQTGRVDGVFRMDTPLLNIGYQPSDGLHGSGAMLNLVNATVSSPAGIQPQSMNNQPAQARTEIVPRSTVEIAADCVQLLITDCCPRSSAEPILQVLNMPFQTPPPHVDPFLSRGNLLRKETLSELSYYASDNRTTYVKLLLTLTPRLPAPAAPAPQLLPSTVYREDRPYVNYIQYFLEQLAAHNEFTASRPYKLFVTNSSGLQILLSRYLCPMAPPPGYQTPRALLHLVSSIPFMKDTQAFLGSIDLWCTVSQFWDMGAGDEEEHAVVLYNYLRYILYRRDPHAAGASPSPAPPSSSAPPLSGAGRAGRDYPLDQEVYNERIFLALGRAVPEGETVYVVVRDMALPQPSASSREPQTLGEVLSGWFQAATGIGATATPPPPSYAYTADRFLVINPCTGHVYSAIDPYCPLKEIYVLATPYNLFANIQPACAPQSMMYDVFNPRNYRAFFGAKMPPPAGGLTTIQDEIPLQPTDSQLALEIERAVYQALRNNIRRWRSRRLRNNTTFHPEVSNIVQELLPQLEHWKIHGPAGTTATTAANTAERNGRPENERVQLQASNRDLAESLSQGGNRNQPAVIEGSLEWIQSELESRMKTILRTRVFRGCPLNIPFTDVEEVVAKIRTLCMHEAKHPEVQFVLAVRAFPLFNGVVSLWVFFGTLEATLPGGRPAAGVGSP